MAKSLPDGANGLHEGSIFAPISTNESEAVGRQVEGVGGCRTDDENVSPSCCVPRRISWWKPSVEENSHTIDFCLDTSLHGLKYVGQPQRHFLERIFWFMSFVIGCVVAAWLIAEIWVKYYNNPIVVTFQHFETNIEQIPFPAVTICNMNKVLKSKAEPFIKAQILGREKTDRDVDDIIETEIYVYYLDQICNSSKSFSVKLNDSLSNPLSDISYTPIKGNISLTNLEVLLNSYNISDYGPLNEWFADFLSDNTQTCENMILRCLWRGKERNCSELFKRNGASEFGTCCTFNMVPQALLQTHKRSDEEEDTDEKEAKDEVPLWPNKDLGIDDLFMPDGIKKTKNPKRQRRSGRSSGLSILINPSLSEYFCTDSDSEGFLLQTHLPIDAPHVQDFGIAIKPNSEAFISIKPEITMANPAIRSYRMDKRNCYFHGEFTLAYYNYYTISNCLDECIANQTYLSCKCVLFYMPRDDSRITCDPPKLLCAENTQKEFLKDGIKKFCSKCYPTCTELEYVAELTSTPLQSSGKLMADYYTEADNGSRSNISIVHIYFDQDSTYPRYRTKLFGWTDLIANTGGLMGLCLGFSGLSLIECLYFFTLRAWCRTRERRSIWAIVSSKFHKIWGPGEPLKSS